MAYIANRLREAWDAHVKAHPRATKKALADFAGVSPQAVSGWFRTGRIAKNNLVTFAKYVGANLEKLAAEVDVVDSPADECPDPDRSPSKMGRRLLELMAMHEIPSIETLADNLRIPAAELEAWIYTESSAIDARALLRAAYVLGTNPSFLLGDTDDARVQHYVDLREARLLAAFRGLSEESRDLLLKTATAWQLEPARYPFRFPTNGPKPKG